MTTVTTTMTTVTVVRTNTLRLAYHRKWRRRGFLMITVTMVMKVTMATTVTTMMTVTTAKTLMMLTTVAGMVETKSAPTSPSGNLTMNRLESGTLSPVTKVGMAWRGMAKLESGPSAKQCPRICFTEM